ncbi:MAG: type II toxin-antitoxin system RelE/ParE family toxin [Bacteroidia bacterium]
MIVLIDKKFKKDLSEKRDVQLNKKVAAAIRDVQVAGTLQEIQHLKKLKATGEFYRIRIGDYRIGIEKTGSTTLLFVRFIHRKDIYRYFP